MSSHFNTFVAEVSCPKCQHPILCVREDPRGVNLPYCCGFYWVPRWKVVNGKLQFHLNYYRPEGMAYEKHLIHENEIQEDQQSTTDPEPTRPKDVEHNVEHNDKAIAIEFISTYIVSAPEHFQTADTLYSLYQKFAERKSIPLEARKLYALLRERHTVEKTRRRVNGKLTYGFIGIRCDAEGL